MQQLTEEELFHALEPLTNLTIVLSTLAPKSVPGSKVQSDTFALLEHIAAYLAQLELQIIPKFKTESGSGLLAIPFFLIEKCAPLVKGGAMRFELCHDARQRVAGGSAYPTQRGGIDAILLSGFLRAGPAAAVDQLHIKLNATLTALTEKDYRRSQAYDLTHEIIYAHLLSEDLQHPGLTGPAAMHAVLEKLMTDVTASDSDLGAELLACYWITGGDPNSPSAAFGMQQLKAHSDTFGKSAPLLPKYTKTCGCNEFAKHSHIRITMLLALGLTMAVCGDKPMLQLMKV